MHDLTILALVEAGKVKEDDDVMGFMQGISLEHSRTIADWLCLTTGTPVKLRFMSFEGAEHIEQTPEGLALKMAANAAGVKKSPS